jgi:hypothetical protein
MLIPAKVSYLLPSSLMTALLNYTVLTLLFTNPEGLSVDTVWAPVFNSSGIAQLAYVPPSTPVKQSDWPTLGGLIQSGKRVVVFMDFNR